MGVKTVAQILRTRVRAMWAQQLAWGLSIQEKEELLDKLSLQGWSNRRLCLKWSRKTPGIVSGLHMFVYTHVNIHTHASIPQTHTKMKEKLRMKILVLPRACDRQHATTPWHKSFRSIVFGVEGKRSTGNFRKRAVAWLAMKKSWLGLTYWEKAFFSLLLSSPDRVQALPPTLWWCLSL